MLSGEVQFALCISDIGTEVARSADISCGPARSTCLDLESALGDLRTVLAEALTQAQGLGFSQPRAKPGAS